MCLFFFLNVDIQVVATDKNPVDLWYAQNLDYVWILNWRSEMDVGIKTVQIIKEAAQRKKHHTIRPEPIDAQFDLVKGLYIPQQHVRLLTFFSWSLDFIWNISVDYEDFWFDFKNLQIFLSKTRNVSISFYILTYRNCIVLIL